MVILIAVIVSLIFFLIFIVMKNQNMAKELREYRHLAKNAESKSRFALTTVDSLARQIQKILMSQLESSQKRGLVKGDKYEKAKVIFNCFEYVVMQCCEHGATVEESLNRALSNSEIGMEDVKKFISEMPSEVRMAWVKNNVGSFVVACNNINSCFLNPSSTQKEIADKSEPTEQAS